IASATRSIVKKSPLWVNNKTTLGDSFMSIANLYILTHFKAFGLVFIGQNLNKRRQKLLLLLN
ncbi:MAG: hypothetical protein ACK4WI_09235, partial [Microcystis sp.]|uniref:hypothetical protein n=1 Tax=Microcystis sp. TaxID=1127 RepID=UPI003919B897